MRSSFGAALSEVMSLLDCGGNPGAMANDPFFNIGLDHSSMSLRNRRGKTGPSARPLRLGRCNSRFARMQTKEIFKARFHKGAPQVSRTSSCRP